MKKTVLLGMLLLLLLSACVSHTHVVGNGPNSGEKVMARQWYALWGLVPLNQIDTKAMAGNSEDYEIKTEYSPVDIILGIPASYITVSSRTVIVTK